MCHLDGCLTYCSRCAGNNDPLFFFDLTETHQSRESCYERNSQCSCLLDRKVHRKTDCGLSWHSQVFGMSAVAVNSQVATSAPDLAANKFCRTLSHGAGKITSDNAREHSMRESALHACHIARIDARSLHFHQYVIRFHGGNLHFADLEITDWAMFPDIECFHDCSLRASAKTGSAASCKTIENAIRAGRDLSYNMPMMALPANQNRPKPVSKIPNAVLRFGEAITGAITALRQESCAPIPIPQRIMPTSSVLAPPRKTNGAKNAGTPKATSRKGKPTLSNNFPKIGAETAPEAMAAA